MKTKITPTREVRLKIHQESDLFTSLDPDGRKLSEEVISYFTRYYVNIHRWINEKYVIRIISDTPVNEEHVRESIKNEFLQKKDDTGYSLKKLTAKEFYFGILGVAITSLWLFLSYKYENVGVEILSIAGWIALWEAISIAIVQRPEIRYLQKNLLKLANADIIIDVADAQE